MFFLREWLETWEAACKLTNWPLASRPAWPTWWAYSITASMSFPLTWMRTNNSSEIGSHRWAAKVCLARGGLVEPPREHSPRQPGAQRPVHGHGLLQGGDVPAVGDDLQLRAGNAVRDLAGEIRRRQRVLPAHQDQGGAADA